ncbi:MAG: RluA family pseudouridine synthase [Pirellulales bacterium]
MNPVVLYEDNHLLVLNKPIGMVSQGALPGEPSAVEWTKDYLKRKYDKPGNVFVGVVSRLDRDVSGVLVLARTSKGAARLSEQIRERTVKKIYWAVVPADAGLKDSERLEDWLAEDKQLGRMAVVDRKQLPPGAEARADFASLEYRCIRRAGGLALLEVDLETGRKHQIRVQLAARGHAVVGDRKYGSRERFPAGIALHARQMTFRHPTRDEMLTLEAPCPAAWRELGFDSARQS